jgi:phosphatidylglycerophosphatase C
MGFLFLFYLAPVVSASLSIYLTGWCNRHNLDLICTVLEVKKNILTGRYINGVCTVGKKLSRICKKYSIKNYSKTYAYGDSDDDREMFSIAYKKIYRWRDVEAHPYEVIS